MTRLRPVLSCLFLAAIAWLLIAGCACAALVVLDDGTEIVNLNGHVDLLIDEGGGLSFEQIRTAQAPPFADSANRTTIGFTDAAVWLRFELTRAATTQDRWWLRVGPSYQDQIQLFTIGAEGQIKQHHVHLDRNWSRRPVKDRAAVFPLDVPAKTRLTCYLRITNRGSVAWRLSLWRPEVYNRWNVIDALLSGGAFVTALVIVLINLFYWYHLRERILLVYASYVAALGWFLFQLDSYPFLLLQPDMPFKAKLLNLLSAIPFAWFLYLLYRKMVQPERFLPGLARWYHRIAALAALLAAVLALAGLYQQTSRWYWRFILLCLVVNLLSSLYLWLREKDRLAFYYLVSFSVFIAAACLRILNSFGVIPYNFWVEHSTLLGAMCHWVLIQMVVMNHINQLRQDHLRGREIALAAAVKAERELETIVQERTRMLQQATDDLQLTQQRLAEALEEERKTNLAQHQFLRMVAHEFRTPLTVIQSTGTLLDAAGAAAPEVRGKALERHQAAVERMLNLVERALTLDRFESASWRANTAEIRLTELLQQIVTYARKTDMAGHAIQLESPDLVLHGDRDLLEIAVNNLLVNALQYSPAGSTVTVSALHAEESGEIHIRVADQAKTLSDEEVDTLFIKYSRGQQAGTPGLGLGLYLVDQITRLHGGQVRISRPLDGGNCFSLCLPESPLS
ncbi:MAG: sensor histidine kinase [Desulfuromonadaceae bacterium]|nr:sensor histidine kinase [Desulfuromonadaceae bacterium]